MMEEIELVDYKNITINSNLIDLFSMDVNEKIINIMIELSIKKIKYYKNIENTLLEIIHNDNIDIYKIPELLILINKTYLILKELKIKMNKNKRITYSGDIIKLFLILLINKGKIISNNDLIDNYNSVIDTAIELMKLPLYKNKISLKQKIKKFFNRLFFLNNN
jgi:hypothetical protein